MDNKDTNVEDKKVNEIVDYAFGKEAIDKRIEELGKDNFVWTVATKRQYHLLKMKQSEAHDIIKDGNNSVGLMVFKTAGEAIEYMLMGKPMLSLNDLLSVWDKDSLNNGIECIDIYKSSPLFKNFQKLAEQKLNNK